MGAETDILLNKILNSISGGVQTLTSVSGQPVSISGQISGATIISLISGQSVIISGQIVSTSGQVSNISGQIVRISGQEVAITPLLNTNIHNSTITPNTFILSNAVTPSKLVSLFRVQAAMSFAGVLSVSTSDGANSGTVTATTFNQNQVLTSGSLYIFDHEVHSGESVNYAYSTSSLVINFHVQEMAGGTY